MSRDEEALDDADLPALGAVSLGKEERREPTSSWARERKSLKRPRTVRGGGGKRRRCVDLQVIATSPRSPCFLSSDLMEALWMKHENN